MAKKETQKDKKVKELLLGLAGKKTADQIKAVKSLKVHGNETAIEPLVQVLALTESEPLKEEIMDLLNTIKSTAVPEHVIRCLNNPDYANASQALLASIWNSGLDYRQYLGDIATATVNGDFMHAMECITILENIDGTLGEDEIMDAIIIFKGYLVDVGDTDDSKNNLIREMVASLQNMNDTV